MKTSTLFATLLLICVVGLTSCTDNPDSIIDLNNLQQGHPCRMATVDTDNLNNWTESKFLNIQTYNTNNYSSWSLQIGTGSGFIHEESEGNHNHWRGTVSIKIVTYDWKNKKEEHTVMDNLSLDTKVENNYNEWTYSCTGNDYAYLTIKTDRPDDYNNITVYQNNAYLFAIKTNSTDDMNAWSFIDFKKEWWGTLSMTSLYFLPVLFTVVQV